MTWGPINQMLAVLMGAVGAIERANSLDAHHLVRNKQPEIGNELGAMVNQRPLLLASGPCRPTPYSFLRMQ